MYDLQVFFFLFSMLLLPSCWSLEAQIVTYDRSVACAFDIYSNVGKIPFFFPPKVAKIPLFSNSFMDFAFRSVITFWVIFCIWGEGINFQLFGPICWKDGFSGILEGQLLIMQGITSEICVIWSVDHPVFTAIAL